MEISTLAKDGSPKGCKCARMTMNGIYSPGPIVRCTGCIDVSKATQKNSCPYGTKIFSPQSRADWKTFVDITFWKYPGNECTPKGHVKGNTRPCGVIVASNSEVSEVNSIWLNPL